MSELAKKNRQDSLLLGLSFGDSRQFFYDHCHELNKKKLVTQGPGNSAVEYDFSDSRFHKSPTNIRLLFYPKFDKNNIMNEMDLEFSYLGWAPWNNQYQSDRLLPKLKELLMSWYGGNAFIYAHVAGKDIPVKLDSNRRILIYVKDTQTIVVKIQDILHPRFQHSISN